MKSEKGFIYRNTMKNARALYKSMGIPIVVFLIAFGFVREELLVPALGRIWGLVLRTTPDGFISNGNLINALLKSPWVIPAGLILIVIYALFSVWQASAIITGIGYMHQGYRIKLGELVSASLRKLRRKPGKGNWLVLVYALVILPLSNLYQTNDFLSSFVIPEYIQDFIDAKFILTVILTALIVLIVYLALRWLFVLPSYFLEEKNFRDARNESRALTKKKLIRHGLNTILYNLLEVLRLSIVPALIILLPLYICYRVTSVMQFSASLYSTLGLSIGLDLVQNISGTLVQISTMAFLIELYYGQLEEAGIQADTKLPAPKSVSEGKISIYRLQLIVSLVLSLILSGCYLWAVNHAQKDSRFILDLVGRTEIIAHKGYSSRAPENTMPAFDLADKSEAVTYIELDVWSSKDGVPVVIHNSTISDATGIDRYIYDCTYEELKKIPAPYNMPAEDFPTARIPSLEEVISSYADSTPLLIEIKGFKQDPELPAKVVELMKKYGCEHTSLVQSGDYGALKAVKKEDPGIECGLILAIVTGAYYDVPYADFFSIEHTFLDFDTVEILHDRGKDIFVWTVNYPESVDRLRFTGVDGVITDYPDDIYERTCDSNELFDEAAAASIRAIPEVSAIADAFENFDSGEY